MVVVSIFLHYKKNYVSGQLFGLKLYEINVLKKRSASPLPRLCCNDKREGFLIFSFCFVFLWIHCEKSTFLSYYCYIFDQGVTSIHHSALLSQSRLVDPLQL